MLLGTYGFINIDHTLGESNVSPNKQFEVYVRKHLRLYEAITSWRKRMSTDQATSKVDTPKNSKIGAMRIPTRGMTIDLDIDVDWVQQALLEGISGNWVSFEGIMTVKRMDERLDAEVHLTYAVECPCEVCGATIRYVHSAEVELIYQPFTLDPRRSRHVKAPQTVKDLEKISHQVTLQEDQLDMGWYENGELDLATVLTETGS